MAYCSRNRLAQVRETVGLSQRQLAHALGVHPSTVSRWESGASRIADERKQELAEHLGVSVSYLMGWDELPDDNGNGDTGDIGHRGAA